MTAGDEGREAFEKWISGPPYERDPRRFPDDATQFAWPGNYRDLDIDLAWQAWQAARAAQADGEPVAGWKLVPVEPTFAMWDVAENASMACSWAEDEGRLDGTDAFEFPTFRIWSIVCAYRAMLSAAPTPPTDADRTVQAEAVEALRKDAERYRWLRNVATSGDWCDIGGRTAETTDAFIDAAIARAVLQQLGEKG